MRTDMLEIRKGDDFHLHLRQEPLLTGYAQVTASQFCRAVVMPNTVPPVCDVKSLNRYSHKIQNAASGLEPVRIFKLLPGMTSKQITELEAAGALAGKYYPAGATTHSEDGIRSWREISDALKKMEELGLILSIHGEDPEAPVLSREQSFLPELSEILAAYPGLRVILEHVSSKEGVRFVEEGTDRLAATVTLHHLTTTLEELLGGGLNPHLFCRPLVKDAEDRDALQRVVFSGNRKFFFGSDSAPHLRSQKECTSAAAGLFSAPVLMPALTELFEQNKALDKLEDFISRFGAEFYGLPLNRQTIRMIRMSWKVPDEILGVVPFRAGEFISWKVDS